MTANERRLLRALIIGPMNCTTLSKAITMSKNFTQQTIRKFKAEHLVILIITPAFKGWEKRYALTRRGAEQANLFLTASGE
jgi:hypothetical protein